MSKPDFEYIAKKRDCGCVVAICADLPGNERETAKDVAAWIRAGLIVERISHDQVAAALEHFGCMHREPKVSQLQMLMEGGKA